MSTVSRTARQPRDLGLDAARGIAIIAMVIAHAVPWFQAPQPLKALIGQVNDLASPLFALVMGVSAGLVARRVLTEHAARWPTATQFAVRAVLLVVIGELLGKINLWIAVVLQPLGLTALLGALVMFLRVRYLAVLAVACWLLQLLNTYPGNEPNDANWRQPAHWLHVYVLSDSHYRVTGLLPVFLLGLILGRVGHARPRVLRATLALGVLAAAAWAFGRAMGWSTYPGRFIDNTHDLALSGIVFALVGMAAATAPRAGTVIRALLRPVATIGTVALSLYALQFVLIRLLVQHGPDWLPFGWKPAVVFIVACLLISWLWARLIGTGPIEWVVNVLSGRRRVRRAGQRAVA
ncbi:acyltransferase family protein [Flexivirga meconopsidis]|uniref:acyltransferase family protein n=1 Tax=Flexivirga meconopsidis TaxID=2977121 RepID=UPI002240A817